MGDQSSRKPSQVLAHCAHTGFYRGNLISFVLCLVDYFSFLNLYEVFVSISALIGQVVAALLATGCFMCT